MNSLNEKSLEFNKKIKSDYNSHYGANGYHPLLMFDGLRSLGQEMSIHQGK